MSILLAKDRSEPLQINLQQRRSETTPLDRFWTTIQAFLNYRALRRTEVELQSLSDRTLRDIGLTRSEIGSVLRNLAKEHRRRGSFR